MERAVNRLMHKFGIACYTERVISMHAAVTTEAHTIRYAHTLAKLVQSVCYRGQSEEEYIIHPLSPFQMSLIQIMHFEIRKMFMAFQMDTDLKLNTQISFGQLRARARFSDQRRSNCHCSHRFYHFHQIKTHFPEKHRNRQQNTHIA